ncbi:MerR family transcriptional regulator [Actinokineospora auranticolor]|uniref:DNA-binding transcriptional MerR regulator n=1 Tax=Actinokineospora auranticolor TaxID=155976 RepID=A0A2S6H111_9PSEU|nr:MerR family transcriptional regulator [Actinokineospora auranticolor]PPK71110.1 DNA-binding transcriptional MerR regulator [Actinokineospora auranticolor]
MRIGDAAAAAGLTPRALRYYEQRGLVAARRTPSGQREYDEADLRRLGAIRELLAAGLTIADVEALVRLIDDGPRECGAAVAVTAGRLADLDDRIARLTATRTRLADTLGHRFAALMGHLADPVT